MTIKERIRKLDSRLSKLPRRQLILLMSSVAVLFLAIGAGVGLILINRNAATSSSDNGNNSPDATPEVTSLTGVLRSLSDPKDGIEFYLEESDGTHVLLDTADRFDSAFLEQTKNMFVAVEGKMTGETIDSKDVFLVEKLVVSF